MDSFESQLHSAVAFDDLEAAELVLKERMNIIFKYEKGFTPLDLLVKKRIEVYGSLCEIKESLSSLFRLQDEAEELLYSYAHSNKILAMEKKEKLSMQKLEANEKFIEMLLKHASVVPNCTKDHWMVMFCAACTLTQHAWAQCLLEKITDVNQPISENSSVWPGYTGIHFAALCGNITTIKMLIDKGANLLTCDAKGVTPLDICFKSFRVKEVYSILNWVPGWENILFSDGKTKLMNYIPLLLKSNDHKCYLQDVGKVAGVVSSKVSPLWPGYTTLHLAIHLLPETKYDRIYRILNCGASVTAQDNYGSTPVHLAFCLGKMKFLSILLRYHEKPLNPLNKDNLSHLHIVSAVSHEHMVRKLLTIEANINVAYNGRPLPKLKPGWTPLNTACSAEHAIVAKMLLDAGAKLIQKAHPKSIEEIFPLSKVLIENCNESLLKLFVSQLWKEKKLQQLIQKEMGFTLLHIVCFTVDIIKIKVLVKRKIDVNAKVHLDSPIWPGFTPLHALVSSGANHIRKGVSEALQLLLNKEADVTLSDVNGNTSVHLALKSRDKNQGRTWAKILIQHHRNYSVNPTNKEGLSHFHISCLVCNPMAVEEFLQWGAEVNQPVHKSGDKFAGKTPLHLVLDTGAKPLSVAETQLQTVDLLLKRCADVNTVDARGYTPLHYVAKYNQGRQELLDRLVRKDTDMNKETIEYGKTPFEILIHNNPSINEIKLFMKHGSCVNSYNRINHKGYMAMIIDNKCKQLTSILKLMMSSPDIAAVHERGRNAIFNTFWCDEIYLSEEELATIIEKLIKLGCDLHYQDRERKTPLHLAVELRNAKAVSALLMCGADINFVDSTGRSPFSYCAQPAISKHAKKFHPVLIALIEHLRKLQSVQLEVSQLNDQLLAQVHMINEPYHYSFQTSYWIEEDESEEIKKIKIGERGLTLYDFVFENDVVKIMSSFTQAEKNIVSKVLQSINYETFWSLKYILKLQYRKVLERPSLIVAAGASLNILFGSPLDDLCTEIIFKYLTNIELKCLVNATI